ncbi:MAG: M23 family metallopeptidase [Candidatus Doudnabacteria bacterium]|nr:M23 family metallopeptidase [Candidatus Doudnabacteria bacterium]
MSQLGRSEYVIQLSQYTVAPEDSQKQSKSPFNRISITGQAKRFWQTSSKFTIHPFKSLHAKHLLPLSPTDYMARFGLELVIFGIAVFSLLTNLSITAHANHLENEDESVIFSFLKNNPGMNSPLLATTGTSTILARADHWVNSASAQTGSPYQSAVTTTAAAGLTTIQENVIVKTNPADTQNFLRHGTTEYTVTSGDSVISIASSFGVSPQTIMMENNISESSTLKPGQKLTILPTTGVTHVVGPTESIESIARKYNVSEDDILDLNDIEVAEDVSSGAALVIPLAKVVMPASTRTTIVKNNTNQIALKQAPVPAGFVGSSDFIWPTPVRTITQGFHRLHSGIDISDSKREPIYAAADGFVELSGWRTGYGNTVIINHGNGFKTLYGHSSEIYVKAGDKVTKGQVIAKQGNTGRVRGATGIHLHFEIIKNGVKVNPLSYVRP